MSAATTAPPSRYWLCYRWKASSHIQVLDTVTRAREAGAALLGAASPGEVAFGLNCSNLMFHLARALEDGGSLQPGDNILLSRSLPASPCRDIIPLPIDLVI